MSVSVLLYTVTVEGHVTYYNFMYVFRNSEIIQPTVDGLRQFGITKGEITRVVVKFSCPPPPHPLTVCFHFPSTFLTHRYVLDMTRSLIQSVEGARVTAIQFVDRNTIHGSRGLDNRWLVTLNKTEAMNILHSEGLHLFNRRILVRKYDDILAEEYSEYLEFLKIKRKLYAATEDFTSKEHSGHANLAECFEDEFLSEHTLAYKPGSDSDSVDC